MASVVIGIEPKSAPIGGYRMPVILSCDRLSHRGSSPAFMATRGGPPGH
jgi:hypothetical protein